MVIQRTDGGTRPFATRLTVNAEQTAKRVGETAIQIEAGTPRRAQMSCRGEKPRQEICGPLKWLCFVVNFFIFLGSVGCLALGLYLFLTDPRPIGELVDVFLNPAVLLTSAGLVSGTVALLGLFGALRDNVCLLKMFALFVFLSYLVLVVFTCLLFLLFYSDTSGDEKGISAQFLLHYSIRRYHTNRNVADFVDYMQEQLECCGSTSFRDWNNSDQFKCNSSNPYPERCGVPFSCCRRSVAGGASGGQNPLAPAIRSLQCWQNAQKKREQQLDSEVYVAGCLQPLRTLFDDHALHIGFGVVSVILPVCMAVFLSQCLSRQIDYQRFLLQREERRIARAERRERRIREQNQQQQSQSASAGGGATAGLTQCPPKSRRPNFGDNGKEEEQRRRRRIHHQQQQNRTKSSSPLRTTAKGRDAMEKRRSMHLENGATPTAEGEGRRNMRGALLLLVEDKPPPQMRKKSGGAAPLRGRAVEDKGSKSRAGGSGKEAPSGRAVEDKGGKSRPRGRVKEASSAPDDKWKMGKSPRRNTRGTTEEAVSSPRRRKASATEPTAPPAYFTLQQEHFN